MLSKLEENIDALLKQSKYKRGTYLSFLALQGEKRLSLSTCQEFGSSVPSR
jgi:hypothetical protein